MDKQIRKIEKKSEGVTKNLKSLEKLDKKHDKIIDKARQKLRKK